MAGEIKVGDFELKSGGPEMTVDDIFDNAHGVKLAKCAWFSNAKPEAHVFALTSLQPSTQ